MTPATVREHLVNLYAEGELVEQSVERNFRSTAADGKTYQVLHYNHDAIFRIGGRVRSEEALSSSPLSTGQHRI